MYEFAYAVVGCGSTRGAIGTQDTFMLFLRPAWTGLTALGPLAASGKPVPYSFEGTANVGGAKLNVDVPFTVKGEITQQQVVQAGLRGLGGLLP